MTTERIPPLSGNEEPIPENSSTTPAPRGVLSRIVQFLLNIFSCFMQLFTGWGNYFSTRGTTEQIEQAETPTAKLQQAKQFLPTIKQESPRAERSEQDQAQHLFRESCRYILYKHVLLSGINSTPLTPYTKKDLEALFKSVDQELQIIEDCKREHGEHGEHSECKRYITKG